MTMLQDVRYALRGFRRTPVFTCVAILSLTLAIGVNTAIFSLLNALALRDLPVREPATLVQVATRSRTGAEAGLSYAMFQELTRRQQVFSSVIGWWGASVMAVDVDGEMTNGALFGATGNFYAELGVRPFAGRLLAADDLNLDAPSATQVAVLGYEFWQRAFHGDLGALGRTVRVEQVPFTIVGIAPPGFTGLGLVIRPDVTIPLTAVPLINGRTVASIVTRPSLWIRTIGRLAPGMTSDRAAAYLTTTWPGILAGTVPGSYTAAQRDEFLTLKVSMTSAAKGLEPRLRSRFTQPLVLVMGVAFLVLLIACVNLASLMLSRAAARGHEMRVRFALGAGRWRVGRQLLTEGLLLSAAGAVGGVLFASWTSTVMTAAIFRDYTVAASLDVSPDGRMLAFTIALAMLAAALFSVAPIWRTGRLASSAILHQNTRSVTTTGRAGQVLVATQVALSLVLIAHAGLLVRTLQQVRAVTAGMRTDGVVVAYPSPRPGAYAGLNNDIYYPQVIAQLAALPGVDAATVSQMKPAGGGSAEEPVALVGTPPGAGDGPRSAFTPVAPRFFDTLGIALLTGRDFAWTDHSRAPRVAILSQSLARTLFPQGGALGQRVRVGVVPQRQDLEVVGVVADARVYNLKSDNLAAVYVPSLQEPDAASFKCFVLRGRHVSLTAVQRAVGSLGREYVGQMQTLDDITDGALLQERLTATLGGFFAGLALLLAAIGLYGLMSYAVGQRQREIGIRMALGARGGRVMTDIVRDGLGVTLVGIGLGLAVALGTVPLLQSLLFGITPRDPLTLGLASASLIAVALVSCLLPAARAARVDPMIALRSDVR